MFVHLCVLESCALLFIFKCSVMSLIQEKEGLITELRKELRVSDDQHRELLTRVNGDEIIRRIRFERFVKQLKFQNDS